MRKSYNDSGLTAKRSYRLLTAGLTAILLAVLSSCASQAPLDDAYYWPDKKAQSTQITPNTPNNQKIEYLNVQDTTVTIRINR